MPSRNRWLVVALSATVVLAFIAKRAYDERGQSLMRIAQWEQEQQENAWLDKTVEIKLTSEVPLTDWLAELSRQAGVKLTLHKSDNYKDEMPTVCLPLPPQSARDALQAVARKAPPDWPLHWRPHEGKLVVLLPGSHEWPPGKLQTHSLRPSLSPVLQHQLANAVRTYIEPSTWDEVGGHGTMVEVPGQLVIVHSYDTHLRIHDFLDKLQTHLEQSAGIPAVGLAVDDVRLQPAVLQAPYQRWTRATRAMERKISLDVVDMPLKDVVEQLREQLDVPLLMAQKPLEDAGIQLDEPLTLRVKNLRAATVFELLLPYKAMAIMPARGTSEMLRLVRIDENLSPESQSLVAYPLADFARVDADLDLEQLGKMLQTVVEPESWQDVGGMSSIERIDESLLILQLPGNHAAIEGCLHSLRLVQSGQKKWLPLPLHTRERRETLAKLQEPITLMYERMMLHEVLTDLEQRTGLTFQFHASCYDVGTTPESVVTCELPVRPFEQNLDRMLQAMKLDYRIHDGYIAVIPKFRNSGASEECEVIDARPLLNSGICTFGGLRELLVAAVSPDSWEYVGGPGSIDEFQGLLVVRQEADLLAQVRHVYFLLENDWLPGKAARQTGNLITRTQRDERAPLIRLYAVDDLLKPRGKFSADELTRELHVWPVKPGKPNKADFHRIGIHCGRYLVAWLQDEHVEPLEVKLGELRQQQ